MLVNITDQELEMLRTLRDFHFDDDPDTPGGQAHRMLGDILVRAGSESPGLTQDDCDAIGVVVELMTGPEDVWPRTREIRWAGEQLKRLLARTGQFQNLPGGRLTLGAIEYYVRQGYSLERMLRKHGYTE